MSDKNPSMNNSSENKNNLQQNPTLSPYQQMLQEQQENHLNQQEELSPYQQLLRRQKMQQESPYRQQEPYGTSASQNNDNVVNNEGMPKVTINPPLDTMKEEILDEVIADKQNDLNLNGHKVFIRQPVIQHDDNDYDLIVNEPTDSGSIFSAPTPVYDPNASTDEDTPLNAQPKPEEKKEEEKSESQQSTGFLNSMRNFYSALGENEFSDKPESKAPNVSDEPLPSFTSNTDILETNEEKPQNQQNFALNSDYNIGNKNVINNNPPKDEEPKEFMPVQSDELDGLKKNKEKIQPEVQKKVTNRQESAQHEASFLMGMMQNANNVQPKAEPKSVPVPVHTQEPEQPVYSQEPQQPVVQQKFVNPVKPASPVTPQNPVQSAPTQSAPVQNIQQAQQNIPEQNEQVNDEQYWTYMNNLLERFDDGGVHNDVTDPPDQEQSINSQQDSNDEMVLEQFGQSIEKPEETNVFSKAFKKAQEDLVEDTSDFEESFNINMDEVLPKKKEKKKIAKKVKEPKAKKKSVDGSLGEPFFAVDKKEKSKKKRIVLIVVVAVLALVIIFGVFFGKKGFNSSDNKKYKKLITTAQSADSSWRVIKAKNPEVSFPEGIQKKYTDLYAINSDFVGWLSIKGLDIDLPVVQSDKYEFYINHSFKKKKSGYGTTFMQSDNSVDSLNLNTVIYGKSMKTDKQMFTKLKEYKKIEGYKKAPVIEFNTLYDDYKWKVFAVFITNASPEQDNGYLFKFNFINLPWEDEDQYTELFDGYIRSCKQRSLYNTGVEVKADDRLLTLTTTSNEFKNARLVVVARMVREGESEDASLALVKENSTPRYPQAWYDKKGETNNFEKDKWDPNSLAK